MNIDFDTLKQIAAVQAARRENFAGTQEPRDAALEAQHQATLAELREALEAKEEEA